MSAFALVTLDQVRRTLHAHAGIAERTGDTEYAALLREAHRAITLLQGRPALTDANALDRLNLMFSAPDWSVSMLEDGCEIVRATGRTEVAGAEWDRH